MPPTWDQKSWHREHDDPNKPRVPIPQRRYYPTTLQDLIDIVKEAEGMPDPKPEVRASGSHWALSDAAMTNGFIVETNDPEGDPTNPSRPRLNQTLYNVIPRCLSSEAWRFFISQHPVAFDPINPPDTSKFYLYHVEAGVKIWDLYCRLDAGDDGVSESLAGVLPDYNGPWAMATLGGAGGQTIVGAISTGTHGGDVHVPPIADAVQALHLVGPEGTQYWIERLLPNGAPLVDDEKLGLEYPGIKVWRDTNALRAALISAGRMGIIYSVVLRVVRQYALEQTLFKSDWSTVRNWINKVNDPIFVNDCVQVLLNPNAQPTGGIEAVLALINPQVEEHTCYVQTRTLKGLNAAGIPPRGRQERGGANGGKAIPVNGSAFLESVCASEEPLKTLLVNLMNAAVDAIEQALDDAGIPIIGDVLDVAQDVLNFIGDPVLGLLVDTLLLVNDALGALLDLVSLSSADPSLEAGGGTLATIANWCAEHQHMELFRRVADFLFGLAQPPAQLSGISYAIMDIHNYAAPGRTCEPWGDSLEVFFDAGTMALVTFVETLLQRVKDLQNGWITGQRMAFAGYVSIRFTGRSMGLLAMQQSPVTCSLEIAAPGAVKGTMPFLKQVEADAVALGARVHWGQRNDLDMLTVEGMYGASTPSGPLYRWREVLSRLSHHGRLATFSTAFTRDRGLEIVQPVLQMFTVWPMVACAGSTVTVHWDAQNNPPHTAATLEIRKPWSTGPAQIEIGLGTLSGSRDVGVPAGGSDFRLVIEYTLNGRTLSDSATLSVIGLQDHDTVSASDVATCQFVEGTMRWAVSIVFDSSSYSGELAVEELTCDFTNTSAWSARREGGAMTNVAFTPASKVHALPGFPRFQGTWTFFVDAPACAGPAPLLSAQFRLVCRP